MRKRPKMGLFSKKIYVLTQINKMVFRNMRSDALRTFLTCLGIIIGTASLIVMMTIMDLRTEESEASIDKYGLAEIDGNLEKDSGGLLEKDIRFLKGLDNTAGFSPVINSESQITVKVGNNICKNVDLLGVASEYLTVSKTRKFIKGASFSKADVDDENYVCVITKKLANKLFNTTDCIGEELLYKGLSFRVYGVYISASGGMDNYGMLIPYTVMKKLTGNGIYKYYVYPASHRDAEELSETIISYMVERFHDDDGDVFYCNFDIYNLTDAWDEITNAAILQIVIAGIALLIGGIGIMNMMLVSVSERVYEIGLRKALGSSSKRIQLQFVMEAVMLSITGGSIGIILGVLFSVIYCIANSTHLHINIASALVSFFFSMAVGVFFGWAPAKTASALQPIDALKGE
ncbi:MAG: ABC transporter permease [Lachnospiraceae bacterium]|nr:ABC transporter permease [Lachnospiraceae bacterium]